MAGAQRREPYADRHTAGEALLEFLSASGGEHGDALVLALPRGGVPVAVPIASGLPAPLDVLLVRKLGHPRRPELAMGAVARVGGTEAVVRNAEVAPPGRADAAFSRVLDRERLVIFARERVYRSGRPPARMAGRTLILVDDGLATGATMRAAVSAARTVEPALITVAVPIASPEACALLGDVADDLVCPWRPAWFVAVGQGYRDFRQIGDDEVVEALA